MRILIAGAGATGGALGARLLTAGRDVTFLVREARAAALNDAGLRFSAPDMRSTLTVNATTQVDEHSDFDLIVIAVKAPALPAVLESIAPAVKDTTVILPLLNGTRHIDLIDDAYPGHVVGGTVKIVATIDSRDTVVQMTTLSTLTIGALDGSALDSALLDALDVPGVELVNVDDIVDRLWEKWAFIASAGITTCLFRAPVGAILDSGGEAHIHQAIAETEAVTAAAGHPVSSPAHAMSVAILTEQGSAFTSSLYRDLLAGHAWEAEHILGDLADRARDLDVPTPLLDIALVQIRASTAGAAASTPEAAMPVVRP